MRRPCSRSTGSVLVWTVLIISVLSVVGAEVLRVVTLKYQSALQTSIWQESLVAAESGIDLAIVEMRKSLYPVPNHSWEGWDTTPGDGVTSYGLSTIPNSGLAGTPMTIEVMVDAPGQLKDPQNSWQYYRIRATGTMPITGGTRVTGTREDARLRKLSLQSERFTDWLLSSHPLGASEVPHASRRVEAIVRPVSSFELAIMSLGTLDLTNQDIVVDSYDSRDPAKSTLGLYDPTKRQQNGDIATNGNLIEAGNAHVYGDVATNSGTVSGAANITGIERTDFYQEPVPVSAPSWPSINPSPWTVNGNATIAASSVRGSQASRYVLSQISISGGQTLTLAGKPDGSPTYVEIHVTGNVTVGGTSQIVVGPGVSAAVFFDGNVNIQGNGMVNSNNQPGDLELYGIQPPNGVTQTVTLGGNGQLTAAVYAPGADIAVNGSGSQGHVYGSFVGKTVVMNGVTNLHYDEALAKGGLINNYKIVSWFEDTR
jgi:hypothetical protein